MTRAKNSPPGRLQVQVRRTVGADGEVVEAASVPCPRRAASVPVDECLFCERCEGLEPDGKGGAELLCEVGSRAWSPTPGTTLGTITVSTLMTPAVVCVKEDVDVETVARLLLELGVSGLPVVTADGHPLGVITKTDLVRHQYEEGDAVSLTPAESAELGPGIHAERVPISASEVMTPISFQVLESASVGAAAALMAYEGVHRLPVVDEEDRVVGVITALDIARWVAETEGYVLPAKRAHRVV